MDKIQILGSNGSRMGDENTTCILIDEHTVIDAGNLIDTVKDNLKINNIFLTHSHLDHILDIPFFVDLTLAKRTKPLNIYGSQTSIDVFKKNIFNWDIWPNFEEITILSEDFENINFIPIEPCKAIEVDNIQVIPFLSNHTVATYGYLVRKECGSFIYSGDTYYNPHLWRMIDENPDASVLLVDVSFPSSMQHIADTSKHFSPYSLQQDMKQLKRKDITFFATHLKPSLREEISEELATTFFRIEYGGVVNDMDYIDIKDAKLIRHSSHLAKQSLKTLNDIGKELSANTNLDDFLEFFTKEVMNLTHADGGTLYIVNEKELHLSFRVVNTRSLGIAYNPNNIPRDVWNNLPLYKEDGTKNLNTVATTCALTKKPIFIDDIYKTKKFDFSGAKEFDKKTTYRSQSMMCIPLLNHEKKVIGVLQLLNKISASARIVPFKKEDKEISLSLGSQIAVLLSNNMLIQELETLLESFLGSVITALEEKSKHTSTHIHKMVQLSNMFVEQIDQDTKFFKDKNYSLEEKQVVRFSALLHDIGKLSTPEYILNKATKLQTIFDRIEILKLRFDKAKKCAKIDLLEAIIKNSKNENALKRNYEKTIKEIDDDFNFLIYINKTTQYLKQEDLQKVRDIGKKTFLDEGKEISFLTEDEIINLTIARGSITEKERQIINNHAAVSVKILEKLPFPKKYTRIPEIAGNHHEKINGKGYPRGLSGDEISFEARILAISDIFEAITSSNRPYKKPNSLSSSMKILYYMAKDGELDKDLVKFLYDSGLYLQYAKKYLKASQIDEVDIDMSDL